MLRVFPGLVLLGLLVLGRAAPASPVPAEIYGKLPAIETPRLSPGGQSLAYLSSVGGRRCLVVRRLDRDSGGRSLCPGPYEVRWYAWKTDSRLILEAYTASDLAGDEARTQTRLVAVDVDGRRTRELVEARAQRAVDFGEDQVIDMMTDDPEHILVSLYRTSRDSPDVVRVNVLTGATLTVVAGQNGIATWKTDGRGHVRLGIGVADGVVRTWYRDDDDSAFRLIRETDAASASEFSALAVAERPGFLYVASSRPTGRRGIYLYEIATGRLVEPYAARPDADIDSLVMDAGHPLGYGYTIDEPQVVYTDPVMQEDAERIAAALPGERTNVVDATPDGRRMLVLGNGGNRPGRYYMLTRVGKEAVLTLLGATRPDIPDDALAPVRPVDYRARDGLTIHAYLTLPPGKPSGAIPFVVLPHGGPSARDSLGFDYLAQMIASRGYGVLQPNFRGSRGYGAAFERAGYQQWGLAMQDDVTDGVKFLVDRKLADPARICIVGWSYGGYAALMGAVKTPQLYRCAVSIAGVTDLRRRLDRAEQSRFADINVPHYDRDPAAILANSPVLHADRIRVPVLLVHGRHDFTVPVADSEAMEAALKRLGKPVESLYFANDDHYLYREDDRIALIKALDRFLAENLGTETVGPAGPGAG